MHFFRIIAGVILRFQGKTKILRFARPISDRKLRFEDKCTAVALWFLAINVEMVILLYINNYMSDSNLARNVNHEGKRPGFWR